MERVSPLFLRSAGFINLVLHDHTSGGVTQVRELITARQEQVALQHRRTEQGHPAPPSEETEEMLPEKDKSLWDLRTSRKSPGLACSAREGKSRSSHGKVASA